MTTEDYVSYETSKLLKEKGFSSDDCHTAYDEDGGFFWYGDYSKDRKGIIDAPTLQMAMKWLREVHHIFISIQQHTDMSYVWYVYKDGASKGCDRESHNNTYEEACESAIKYCLKN